MRNPPMRDPGTPGIRRRGLLALGLTTAAVTSLAWRKLRLPMAYAATAEVATGTSPFGVCIHTTWRDNAAYGNDSAVLKAVQDCGADYARDLLGIGSFDQGTLYGRYHAAGIPLHVTVGVYGKTTTADRTKMLARLLTLADYVDSVAGFNEPDHSGDPVSKWLPVYADHQKWLYETVKGTPTLAHMTVLPGALMDKNPNLASELKATYTAIAGHYDVPNLHVYPGPTKNPRTYLAGRLAMVPGGRAWLSECGGSTYNMTEARQSFVCTELVKAQAERGDRAYVYELADDAAITGTQALFGVYHNNFTPKPAATALAGL